MEGDSLRGFGSILLRIVSFISRYFVIDDGNVSHFVAQFLA